MSVATSSCSSIGHCSNLDTFLQSVTPIIKHDFVPLNNSNEVQTNVGLKTAQTKLKDIWEVYDEWSCCGVEIPVLLETGESIVQYYVPYLSAIQIFIKKTTSTGHNHDNYKDDNDNGDEHDHLYVQFNESCSPYMRVPFLDKIIELAQSYPGLLTFYINDISPASWMSVACGRKSSFFNEDSYSITICNIWGGHGRPGFTTGESLGGRVFPGTIDNLEVLNSFVRLDWAYDGGLLLLGRPVRSTLEITCLLIVKQKIPRE